MKRLYFLLLAPLALMGQNVAAVEFTTTSNASQAGVDYVTGYQFTVQSAIALTSLGAVLSGYPAQPVFGALPASMPVGLWDDQQNLIASATITTADPMLGHFNYSNVDPVNLVPGLTYTIAGLVARGSAVMSNVPAMTPGSVVVYGGPKSMLSRTLAFPPNDDVGLAKNYFGASFTYTGATDPVARSGADQNVRTRDTVTLDGSASFSPVGRALTWTWTLALVPAGSAATLTNADTATPSFIADRAGVYVARLICNDGFTDSVPSTVSIDAAPAREPFRAGRR